MNYTARLTDFLIPCVDIEGGRATTPALMPGLDDPWDPLQIVRSYTGIGIRRVFFDVSDGWSDMRSILPLVATAREWNIDALVSMANGKLRSSEDAARLVAEGARAVSVSTAVVESPDLVAETARVVGPDHMMGVVNSRTDDRGRIAYVHGGQVSTGSEVSEFARYLVRLGIRLILANSVDREGTGTGYDHVLTRTVAEKAGVPVIASGGAGSVDHLHDGLAEGSATYVLANKMLHEGRVPLNEVHDQPLTRDPKNAA
ncbi:hypothetical protein CDG81_11975 [Actinopolyspora erythraea]|uniref:Imidazole glycerol phosphate synthase subunit HisF n=1 Tax=Actinopolyspora erythraea TaxID=414996 RepID=A0A223RSN0_9ACTN|nr:HisA/HisF-related TIM barrel protein [Actinopolyspora erythraea]ASU78878.1 hypothetical protein CDG81_11975 [Actinopolyspora erythraea]